MTETRAVIAAVVSVREHTGGFARRLRAYLIEVLHAVPFVKQFNLRRTKAFSVGT